MKKVFIILILGSTTLFSSMGSFAGPHFDRDDSRGGGWQGRNLDRDDDPRGRGVVLHPLERGATGRAVQERKTVIVSAECVRNVGLNA